MPNVLKMRPDSQMHKDYNLLVEVILSNLIEHGFHVPENFDLTALHALRKAIHYKYETDKGNSFYETTDVDDIGKLNHTYKHYAVKGYGYQMKQADLTQGVYNMYTTHLPYHLKKQESYQERSFNPHGIGGGYKLHLIRINSAQEELAQLRLHAADDACFFSPKLSCHYVADLIGGALHELARENKSNLEA